MDKFVNTWNNQRKIGVEITEDKMGKNSISGLVPRKEWAAVSAEEREDLWLGTFDLPDRNGNPHTWYLAPCVKVLPFFAEEKGKVKLMRWGKVMLTEDTGEFE